MADKLQEAVEAHYEELCAAGNLVSIFGDLVAGETLGNNFRDACEGR